MSKFMLPNYDKPWRCPGWSGPGWKGGKGECPGGSTAASWGSDRDHWKTFQCPECGTVSLPYKLRLIDPAYWWGRYDWKVRLWFRRHFQR